MTRLHRKTTTSGFFGVEVGRPAGAAQDTRYFLCMVCHCTVLETVVCIDGETYTTGITPKKLIPLRFFHIFIRGVTPEESYKILVLVHQHHHAV